MSLSPTEFRAGLSTRIIDGLTIRYTEGGASDGAPILLLSPWPESIFAFLPTWPAFTAMGRVVAIDLPSFGMSEGREDVRNAEGMGAFILRAIEAFDLDRPHVLAPDIGTPASLFASLSAPAAFSSLTIGSGAIDHTDIGGVLDELVNAPSLAPYRGLTSGPFVEAAMTTLNRYRLPADALQDYVASYAGDRLMQSIEFVRDYPRSLPKLRRLLNGVVVPTQIIVGKNDPFVPVSNAQLLHRLLPNSRLDVLDAGHFVWEDASDQYALTAGAFIRSSG